MDKIGVVGAGRLGICLALNLEKAGFDVFCVDVDQNRVNQIENRERGSIESDVDACLSVAQNIHASTDYRILEDCDSIFICVATPSTEDGKFDHQYIVQAIESLQKVHFTSKRIDVIISATVMPGFTESIQTIMKDSPFTISYNPEFIAQGTIIRDQQFPDQILIGEADEEAGRNILKIRESIVRNEPQISRMGTTEAEVTKLAVNCFLTTKIAFANSIGDLTRKLGGDESTVLQAIGSDKRIGNQFLKYGFGFGGPCLPRDNRALSNAAKEVDLEIPISNATDISNKIHLEFQLNEFQNNHTKDNQIVINQISYKADSDILEESQQLAFALRLAQGGYSVKIVERKVVIDQLEDNFGDLFEYQIRE